MRRMVGRRPTVSTPTRPPLVGPLLLAAQLNTICLCTVLRCLARVRTMPPVAGEVEGGPGVLGAGWKEGEEAGEGEGKVERGKVVNGEGGKEGAEAGKLEGNWGVVGGGD